MRLPDLQEKWHGAPVWVWVGGGTVVTVAGLILLKRWRAKRAGGSAAPAVGGMAGPGGDYAGGGASGGAGFSDSYPEWSNEGQVPPPVLPDLLKWGQPSIPALAPAAPVIDAGTPASIYEFKQVATYPTPSPGMQNTAITVGLDRLNRPPTAEEQAAGEAVIGVQTTPIPNYSFSAPEALALPVTQQPATFQMFGGEIVNPMIPNEFKSDVTGMWDRTKAFKYFYGQ